MKTILWTLLSLTISSPLYAGTLPTSQDHEFESTDSSARWYFGFGPAFLSGLNIGGTGVGIEGARLWPVTSAEIRLALDFSIKGSAYMAGAGIGANYFVLKDDISPYIGGEFGFGLAKADGDVGITGETNGGFTFAFGVGVQFFRRSSVHLDLGLKGRFLLRSATHGTPQVYVLHAGIVF
mgnify:CR=1 FL=1